MFWGRIRFAVLGLILCFNAWSDILPLSQTQDPIQSPVKVRIQISGVPDLGHLQGHAMRVYESKQASGFSESFVSKDKVQLIFAPDGLSQWRLSCEAGQVILSDDRRKSVPVKLTSPVIFQSGLGFMSLNSRTYRDEIRVYEVEGKCAFINALDLEKYVSGILNREVSSEWPLEALKAQAVAARTYAIFQIMEARKKSKRRIYDLENTVSDQVYDGSAYEDRRTNAAVIDTLGLVLSPTKARDRKVIKTFYHSTCGGRTTEPERVWGPGTGGLSVSVKCPYCQISPRYRWSFELTEQELISRLNPAIKKSPMIAMTGPGETLEVLPSGSESLGRGSVVILKSKNTQVDVLAPRFREWLGNEQLRSTWFDVSRVKKAGKTVFSFRGRGNGHGVGLCQWGAKGMSDHGKKSHEILSFYYPGAHLKRLW